VLEGQIWIRNRKLNLMSARDLSKILGVVLTERLDIANMTVYDLLALGRYPYTDWTGRLKDKDRAILSEVIELTDLGELVHRQLSELSDGERQKAMVARALAQEPDLVFLDEPTAFLDLPRRVELMAALRTLAHTTKRCFLVSTHDLDLALRAADYLWLLSPSGDFYSGLPESLVLNGSFSRVFSGKGVVFNDQSGSFEIKRSQYRKISLKGVGKSRLWTARALERQGFEVVDEKTDLALEIQTKDQSSVWKLKQANSQNEFNSLEELINFLN